MRREECARHADAKRKQLERLKYFEEVAAKAERATRLRSLADSMEASGQFSSKEGKEKVAWICNAADWLDPIVKKHWPVVDDY